ncbi:hypothetical protein Sulfitobl28_31720 (plasmid) [Sulfitobacter pontiacus]|nr:hypothetical protein Sulfitobl28_31720 [Sulfitobacter pontiacus]
MTNGCICCTLRDDLLVEVRRLAEEGRFDYLLIESTGISEPLPVAATFDFRDEDGESLSDAARLDTMVTVVDTVNLLNDYSSHDFLRDRGESLGDADDRTLVDLLVDQIEFADVVVLNKVSDAGPEKLDAARKIIAALNPDAQIIETDQSKVPANRIMGTGLFDFDKAHLHPMWAKELYGFADHVPETEEYGVSSFVYRARRPFHPQRSMMSSPAICRASSVPRAISGLRHVRTGWRNSRSLARLATSSRWVTGGRRSPRNAGPTTRRRAHISRSTGKSPMATGGKNWCSLARAWTKRQSQPRSMRPLSVKKTPSPPTSGKTCPTPSPVGAAPRTRPDDFPGPTALRYTPRTAVYPSIRWGAALIPQLGPT